MKTKQIRLKGEKGRNQPKPQKGETQKQPTRKHKNTQKADNSLYQPKMANRILLQMRAILGNLFGVGDSSKWLWVASIKWRKL